jgi:hypothetical protein
VDGAGDPSPHPSNASCTWFERKALRGRRVYVQDDFSSSPVRKAAARSGGSRWIPLWITRWITLWIRRVLFPQVGLVWVLSTGLPRQHLRTECCLPVSRETTLPLQLAGDHPTDLQTLIRRGSVNFRGFWYGTGAGDSSHFPCAGTISVPSGPRAVGILPRSACRQSLDLHQMV